MAQSAKQRRTATRPGAILGTDAARANGDDSAHVDIERYQSDVFLLHSNGAEEFVAASARECRLEYVHIVWLQCAQYLVLRLRLDIEGISSEYSILRRSWTTHPPGDSKMNFE